MNRKLEILIGVLIILSLVAFIGVGVFRNSFDDEAIIGKIADAIENEDLDYLKSHIEIEGRKKGSLSSEDLENIVKMLKNNVSVDISSSYYRNLEGNIYLKKQGKEKFILDKYILVLKEYDLIIYGNVPGSDVYINDEKVGSFADDSNVFTYNSMVPGSYNVKLVYEDEYGKLEKEEELILFNYNESEIDFNIRLDVQFVYITSNIDNATLYINDKDTKIKLDDGYNLGPVPMDGSVSIMAKATIEGNVYESEKVFIDEYMDNHELYIDYVEPVEEVVVMQQSVYGTENIEGKIINLMEGYQYGIVEAINNSDYSYVQPFIENNSALNKSQVNLVKHLSSKGTTEILAGYTIHSINKISDTIYEMQVSEQHNVYYSNGKNDTVSNTWIYTVVTNGDYVYLRDLRR